MFATGHTDKQLRDLGLNDRQIAAVHYLRLNGAIATSEYEVMSGASKATAKRDLGDLVEKGFVLREGKGTSVNYRLTESN